MTARHERLPAARDAAAFLVLTFLGACAGREGAPADVGDADALEAGPADDAAGEPGDAADAPRGDGPEAGPGDCEAGGGEGLPDPKPMDARVYARFPEVMQALAMMDIPADSSGGLLGHNREWGGMYSPHFQRGAGRALRISLVGERHDLAARAFLAIKVGADVIEDDGYVPSSVPEAIYPEVTLSEADVASAAAFFLGDACLGMLALETDPDADRIVPPDDRRSVIARLVLGLGWLTTRRDVLERHDAGAPNRFFFDALAFQACGALGGDGAAVGLATAFVDLGLALFEPAGFFVEGGGWDTGYQAVAIRQAEGTLLAGHADRACALRDALRQAALWEAERVNAEGRVDSSGNTRTCGGGEEFLGEPKKVAPDGVFEALAYVGEEHADMLLLDAALRVWEWVEANPGADPCFPPSAG